MLIQVSANCKNGFGEMLFKFSSDFEISVHSIKTKSL